MGLIAAGNEYAGLKGQSGAPVAIAGWELAVAMLECGFDLVKR
jgi:hypothetical protein